VAGGCADGGDHNGASKQLCVCGHAKKAHVHYRRGTECALCDCPRWYGRGPLSRLLRLRREGYRTWRAKTWTERLPAHTGGLTSRRCLGQEACPCR
jgi:hypothetical protein